MPRPKPTTHTERLVKTILRAIDEGVITRADVKHILTTLARGTGHMLNEPPPSIDPFTSEPVEIIELHQAWEGRFNRRVESIRKAATA